MRSLAKLLLGAALLAAPAQALADPFCNALRAILAAAPGRFESYKGAPQERGWFAATQTLPGARDCELDPRGPTYKCHWRDSTEMRLARYQELSFRIGACFPGAATYLPEAPMFDLPGGVSAMLAPDEGGLTALLLVKAR